MRTHNRLLQCSLFVSTFLACCGEFLEKEFIFETNSNFTNTNVRLRDAGTLVDCASTCGRSTTCRYAAFNNQTQTCIVANDFSHDAGTYALGWIFIKFFMSDAMPCMDCVGYGSSLYKFFDTLLIMPDAQDICENLGGKLVEVETELENNFLKGQMLALNTHNSFWLGAFSYTPDSSFVWFSKPSNPLTFTEFYTTEPNHPTTEFCLVSYQPYAYSWVDFSCNALLSYVCEFSV